MKYIVKRIHNTNGELKILNPTSTILDAKVVYSLDKAYLFDSRDEALDFLKTTTFLDKGYSAFPVDWIDGELEIISSEFGKDY